MMQPAVLSTAVTRGVKVAVASLYVPEQSSAQGRRYVFSYTVTITNTSSATVQLKSRHWIITDADGKVEEVRGPGVVGAQPVLEAGQSFEYTSFCILRTPRGTMRGTYQMVFVDGSSAGFDAEIAPFALSLPYSMN